MVRDRNAPRADLDYLSRRQRPQATPQATRQQAVAPAAEPSAEPAAAAASLSLGTRGTRAPAAVPAAHGGGRQGAGAPAAGAGLELRPGGAPPAKDRPATATQSSVPKPGQPFPAPAFGELRQLDQAHPVVRLNTRQSAIGSLLVTGARSVAWEDEHFTTGAHHSGGHRAGTSVTTPGNRPLAGLQDGAGVVALRHVRQLRRALFIAGETPLTIGVFDGAAAAVAPRNDAGLRTVLYLARIGAVLELRAEFVPADASDLAVWTWFGFSMTLPLDERVLRH